MKLPEKFKPKAIGKIEVEMNLYERIRTANEVVEKDKDGHYVALEDIFMQYPLETNYHRFAEKGKRITEYYQKLIRACDYGWAYFRREK